MTDLTSRPYHPDPDQCCEACAFGRGPHADFCKVFWHPLPLTVQMPTGDSVTLVKRLRTQG